MEEIQHELSSFRSDLIWVFFSHDDTTGDDWLWLICVFPPWEEDDLDALLQEETPTSAPGVWTIVYTDEIEI